MQIASSGDLSPIGRGVLVLPYLSAEPLAGKLGNTNFSRRTENFLGSSHHRQHPETPHPWATVTRNIIVTESTGCAKQSVCRLHIFRGNPKPTKTTTVSYPLLLYSGLPFLDTKFIPSPISDLLFPALPSTSIMLSNHFRSTSSPNPKRFVYARSNAGHVGRSHGPGYLPCLWQSSLPVP